ncbi:MAG TPA: 5'/3'-nucleotidase SurE [Streptosporangiaceae bacterium]
MTNDDGIDSEGLWHLAAAVAQAGLDVVVAAPASDASGIGSAIKADQDGDGRVKVQRRELPGPAAGIPAYALTATPGFIVVIAMRGAFGAAPQYVLSGINRGANTGRGVLSSGTVAAALIALANGVPAAAFSLDVEDPPGGPLVARPEWPTAAFVAGQVILALADLPPNVALSVNIPNLPPARLGGTHRTTLAAFGAIQAPVTPTAEGYLQLGLPPAAYLPDPGSDSAVLASGCVSVTPLRGVSDVTAVSLPWPAVAAPR